jgi:ribonuclease BN (tRNA processing enzyme)
MPAADELTVTFAGSGDAFGSGGRFQACFHLRRPGMPDVLIDCGATSLTALKRLGLAPDQIGAVFVSHLHGDHFGGLPFLILDGQFAKRTLPLTVAGPPGTSQRLTEAMEVMFPGSSAIARSFEVDVVELIPGATVRIAGIDVTAWELVHPSGATPLGLRLSVDGRTIGYTGDTAWTDSLTDIASGADLFIAEAYYHDKAVPYHLRLADLTEHADQLRARRVVLTHLSADMLARTSLPFDVAHDGYTVRL